MSQFRGEKDLWLVHRRFFLILTDRQQPFKCNKFIIIIVFIIIITVIIFIIILAHPALAKTISI